MFNPKISGIVAGTAFILSFLIGLFTGSQFLAVLLRALILSAVFFVLASLAYWLVSQFLPELLNPPSDDDSSGIGVSGSRVDITIDSSNDDAEPEPASPIQTEHQDSPASDNIGSDASVQGLDDKRQDDYNDEGEVVGADLSESTAVPQKETSGSVDILPDLESMSEYFDPSDESDDEENVVEMEEDVSSAAPSAPGPSRTTKTSDPGDFNAQEMASAIQTILRRDEKG